MDARTWTARASACIGKAAFSTPQLAAKVKRRRGRKRDAGKRAAEVYRCPCCGLFHIGTPTKSVHAPPRGSHGDDADMI